MQRLRAVNSLDVSAVAGHHAMPVALLLLFHIDIEGKCGWIIVGGAKGILPPPPSKIIGGPPHHPFLRLWLMFTIRLGWFMIRRFHSTQPFIITETSS